MLFLGDSITLADYVPEEKTWVRLIQERSRRSLYPFETINAGVWAIGLANEIAILKETGLSTKPDIVILGWYLNDAENSPGVRMIPVPSLFQSSRLAQVLLKRFSLSLYGDQVFADIEPKNLEDWRREVGRKYPKRNNRPKNLDEEYERKINDFSFEWGSAYSDGAWEQMFPLFVELKRLSDEHGFKLGIVAFPVADQIYTFEPFDFPQQKLKEVAAHLDVPVLDLLPLFRGLGKKIGKDALFYDWCHPTPYGNELVAEWVEKFLKEQFCG